MLRLTVEREKRGLTRARLGALANIHPAEIGRMESKRVPYKPWIERLGKVFDIPGEELFKEVE